MAVALGAALSTVVTAVPAGAQAAAPDGAGARGEVTFAVFDTGAGIPRDRPFELGELTDHRIPRETVERLAASERVGAEESAAAPLQAPPADRNDIEGEWQDRDGWNAVMRKGWWDGGNSGFGMRKIDQKHNLSLDAVKATTMYPRPGPEGKENIGGTTWNYRTEVLHVECSGWWIFRRCRVTEVMTVRAGLDYRTLDDGKAFGAVTAFCEGVTGRCPDWVRDAVNI
ncbi:hypothetical protein CUT44_12520 [Streptomyces carminius]|uniref:Secreted protein n=1 Tax=Streptomyces carminius TaxID=2665496 RepID=A0A2M8LZX2_9ACTN|nr:hypothetical protein CUT44_12520 [Streptomyces carminius]